MSTKPNGGLITFESETSSDTLFGKYIILDFSAVNYIDTIGFKVLLEVLVYFYQSIFE
jgi:anti-anti-sigma regulatory factor